MGLRLVDGRMFDELRASADRSNASIIVNNKLVEDFGWSNPVGMTVTMYDTTKLTVIGVVEDFYAVQDYGQKLNRQCSDLHQMTVWADSSKS
jgi:hypothetical protein